MSRIDRVLFRGRVAGQWFYFLRDLKVETDFYAGQNN